MKLADAISAMSPALLTGGFRVHFERIEGKFLAGDYFPDGDEPPIKTEAEAWALACGFAAVTKGKTVNLYVIDDRYCPVAGYEQRKIVNREEPSNADDTRALNPWRPMTSPIDLKHLGKLGEELNEAGAAVSRCIIQGIDESEPVTRKPNKEWLENELADVIAGIDLVTEHFGLDKERMRRRWENKKVHLRRWHGALA